jgi:hypothetical protein
VRVDRGVGVRKWGVERCEAGAEGDEGWRVEVCSLQFVDRRSSIVVPGS